MVRLSGVSAGGRSNGVRLGSDVAENRLQQRRIRNLSATEGWELEPDNEGGLECEIPWNIVENWAERDTFKEIEETEYNPVSEPLDVVLRCGRFDSLEREVGR